MSTQRRGAPGVEEVRARWKADAESTFLLDVNVLIALIDPVHSYHATAHAWFGSTGKAAWATCPITQNGLLRIVGHARYPQRPGSPAKIAALLSRFCAGPNHHFWFDDTSVLDPKVVDVSHLLTSGQITDTYLLALAVKHGGKLATFDKRLVTDAVRGGNAAMHLIS